MLLCPCDSWGRGLGSDGVIMLSASSSGFRILGLMGGLVFRSWGSSLNHKPSTKTSILNPELLCGTCGSLNVGYIPTLFRVPLLGYIEGSFQSSFKGSLVLGSWAEP